MTTEVAPTVDPQHNPHTHSKAMSNNLPSMTSSSSWHPSSKSVERETAQAKKTEEENLVLADPNIKFPLENSWSFHFYKNEKTKSWKENVKFITTVDFVEDFWG